MAEKAKRELPSQLKQLLALDVKLSKDVMEAVNRFQVSNRFTYPVIGLWMGQNWPTGTCLFGLKTRN